MSASLAVTPQQNGPFKLKQLHVLLLVVAAFAGLSPDAQAQAAFIDLGSASSFAILAGTSVTNSGLTIVNGDLGVSPGILVTGFGPGVVNGTIYTGTPTLASSAEAAALTAYNILTGETFISDLSGQDLGARTLTPGVYSFSATAGLTGTLILDAGNNPNARFDFLIGSTLGTASSSHITLINLAQANNVFWQVGTSATLGSSSDFVGNLLANTSITLAGTGAMIDGRLLALNGTVSLIGDTISVPTAIPEPATNALVAAFAALGLAFWRRRRRVAR